MNAHTPPHPDARPIAVITGGCKRVGLAIATALARRSFDLILTYHTDRPAADAAVAHLAALGSTASIHQLDLDDPAAVEHFAAAVARLHPSLDLLVHNAAIYAPTPLASLTADDALRFYRVNALAPLLLSRTLAPALARSTLPAGGSIVALADIHALGLPRKNHSAYAMSKAALVEMVRSLARDLAPAVRVNAVAPGVVAWPTTGHESEPAAQAAYLARVPLARPGTPDDAANAVLYLALHAHYTTGHVLTIDGGRSLTS